jgi:hypothetical protein
MESQLGNMALKYFCEIDGLPLSYSVAEALAERRPTLRYHHSTTPTHTLSTLNSRLNELK